MHQQCFDQKNHEIKYNKYIYPLTNMVKAAIFFGEIFFSIGTMKFVTANEKMCANQDNPEINFFFFYT